MNELKNRSVHQRLLLAAYVLGAVSSLLGTLAAIGFTLEKDNLKYPDIAGPIPPPQTGKDGVEPTKRYFEL